MKKRSKINNLKLTQEVKMNNCTRICFWQKFSIKNWLSLLSSPFPFKAVEQVDPRSCLVISTHSFSILLSLSLSLYKSILSLFSLLFNLSLSLSPVGIGQFSLFTLFFPNVRLFFVFPFVFQWILLIFFLNSDFHIN